MDIRNLFSTRILLLLIGFTWVLMAQAETPPNIAAKGYLLIDFDSGNVLAEKQADAPLPPASITKIMTAYLVFKELKAGRLSLSDHVTVSNKARQMGGSRMFLELNTQVSIEELIRGMVIQSGNDAAVALAEKVAGSIDDFASKMNTEAVRLGMKNSHFMNPTGLPDPGHYTTARDIARLTHALIRDFPRYYRYFGEHSFTYNNITQKNRNHLLLRDDGFDGVKTGHTNAAGFCLVASAKRENSRLISVVLGTTSSKARENISADLINYGFRYFETRKLYTPGQTVAQRKVWYGNGAQAILGVNQELWLTLPRLQYKKLRPILKLPERLDAPLHKQQVIGRIDLDLEGNVIKSIPVILMNEIPRGGFFSRSYDAIKLWWD